MTHAALGEQRVGETTDTVCRPAQNQCLDAILVVKVGMHCRDDQIMMRMTALDDTLGKIPFMMIVDVRQYTDT